MRTCQAPLAVTVLLFVGWMPQASACIAGYWDHAVNEATSEIDAWAYVDDSFNVGFCAQLVYEWGYFEHSYSTYVSIESPTQEFEYTSNSGPNFPFGGGSAYTITTISFVDDPGEYIVHFLIGIWCTLGGDVLALFEQTSEEVRTVPAAEPDECGVYADTWNEFYVRPPWLQARYEIYTAANTFHGGFDAGLFDAGSYNNQVVNEFAAGASAWTTSATSCGVYASVEDIQITSPELGNVDVFYVSLADNNGKCGSAQRFAWSTGAKDRIYLTLPGESAYCDDHRVETVYHEIGHLWGFEDLEAEPGPDWPDADLYLPRPPGPGVRTIEGHHLRVLVEKY